MELSQVESKSFISGHILQIESILNIFENLIFRKKESTIEKDLQKTIDLLKSPLYFEVLSQLTLTNEPELIYKASVIMNVIIVCLPDKLKVREFQSQILDYSTLLLRHVEFCMGTCSVRQKHYSIIFICNCLIDNISACNLMMRLIPKPLFYLVEDTLGDISKWSLGQWESLFQNMNQNYNSATQQWNEESRQELLVVLKNETENFYKHYKPISPIQTKAFIFEMFKSPNYQISREQEEKIIQLKWNYEEYEVAHKSLRKKFPVYKFYIEEMVIDKPNPELSVKNFKHPKKFWDELTTTLIASADLGERIKLMKCMILFYKNQYKSIKTTNIVPFLVKQINQTHEKGYNYLLLQLIYTLLENDPQKHNVRRFLDSNGLHSIQEFISENLFEENLNEMNYLELENEYKYENMIFESQGMSTILFNAKLELSKMQKSKCMEAIVFLFNNPSIDREALTSEFLISNQVIFCIKIFQQCILTTKSQTEESLLLIPKPLAKEVAFEQKTIELFHKVLLLKDDRLMIAALDFVMISYIDKFNFSSFIKNKWVFAMLLSRINRQNSSKISAFFEKVITSFYKIAVDEKKLLFEDLRTFNVNSPINDLSLYSKNGNKILSENKVLFEIFDQFPGLCLLPSYFFHVLLSKGPHDFVNILFSDLFESPYLLWNKQALISVQKLLESMLSLAEKKVQPEWQTKTIHYSFADELTVGPILLKNWVFYSQYQTILPISNIPSFLKTLTKQVNVILVSIHQSNKELVPKLKKFYMLTLAISCIYKNHSVYPFEEFDVIEIYLKYYLFHEKDDFKSFNTLEKNYLDCGTINCLKIIYNSIKIENSFEQIDFWKVPSLKIKILKLFQRCIRNTIYSDLPVSFHQFKMNYLLLKILKKIFMINGSLMVSFKENTSGTGNHSIHHSDQSIHTESDSEEPLYDINVVLANLDVMLVKDYINMMTNRVQKSEINLSSIKGKPILDGKKISVEKLITKAKSAFKRKGTTDKDSVFEEQGNKVAFEKPSSLQNCINSKESLIDKKNWNTRTLEVITSAENVSSDKKKMHTGIQEDEDLNMINFRIDVQESNQNNFRLVHKRLDYEQILKMTNNMDLSVNSIAEILSEIKKDFGEKILQSNTRGTSFYHALKKVLQSFFLLWVTLVNNLSQNRKNTVSMIEASIPFITFRIAILNGNIDLISNTPVGNEIIKFCASSLQIFRNLMIPVVELIYQLDKDSENKRRIKSEIRSEVLQNLIETSNIAWSGIPDNIINYFDACANFFSISLICYVINNSNNESVLSAFSRGIYDLKCYLNSEIIVEMNALLKNYIAEQLESNNLTDYKKLKAIIIEKRAEHVCIAGYYIENYIRSPQVLEDAELVYKSVFEVIDSYNKKDSDVKIIIEFLIKIFLVNDISVPLESNEFPIILKSLYNSSDIEAKTIIFTFLKKRLKSRPHEIEESLKSVAFNIALFETFFWIEILNQRPSMLPSNVQDILPIQNFTDQQVHVLVKKYVDLLCYVTKITGVGTFQEIMIYLSMLILENNIQKKLLTVVLEMKELKPQLSNLFSLLIETRTEKSDPVKALLECFHEKTIIHPLIYFNPQKFHLLTTQLYIYPKLVLEKLVTSEQISSVGEVVLDISEIYSNNFESVIVFDKLNLSLFLICKNNSFLLNESYIGLIPKLENSCSVICVSIESFKVLISSILMLRSHEFFSQSTQYSLEVINCYFINSFGRDPVCEILILQYISKIDSEVVLSDERVVNLVKKQFIRIRDEKENSANIYNLVFFECLLLIISKNNSFVSVYASEEIFLETSMNLRAIFPEMSKIINVLLAFCVRNELLSEVGVENLTKIDPVCLTDFARVNLEEVLEKIYKREFIENLSERNNVAFWMEKNTFDGEIISLPLCFKPDLYNL